MTTAAAEQPIASEGRRPFYAPGWYRDLSSDDYHGSFGISSSRLKVLTEHTPAHLLHELGQESAETAATALGTAVHSLVLEPETAGNEIAVLPEGLNLRTKADRAIKAQFEAESEGKVIITAEQHTQAKAMSASVMAHPMSSVLLTDIIPESSVFWWYRSQDPDEGGEPFKQMLKVRPDALSVAHPVIIDLKTTQDASYSGFTRSIQRYYYHLSAAMYLEGVNLCRPLLEATRHFAYTKFVFVCVESVPPYLTAVYELSPEYLDIGKQLYRRAMRILRDKRDDWPGFPEEIRVIDPPPWANRFHVV